MNRRAAARQGVDMQKQVIDNVEEIQTMLLGVLKPRVHYTTAGTFHAVEQEVPGIRIDRMAGREALKKLKAAGGITGAFRDSGHWLIQDRGE